MAKWHFSAPIDFEVHTESFSLHIKIDVALLWAIVQISLVLADRYSNYIA